MKTELNPPIGVGKRKGRIGRPRKIKTIQSELPTELPAESPVDDSESRQLPRGIVTESRSLRAENSELKRENDHLVSLIENENQNILAANMELDSLRNCNKSLQKFLQELRGRLTYAMRGVSFRGQRVTVNSIEKWLEEWCDAINGAGSADGSPSIAAPSQALAILQTFNLHDFTMDMQLQL